MFSASNFILHEGKETMTKNVADFIASYCYIFLPETPKAIQSQSMLPK